MSTEPKLEQYLAIMDKALSQISVSDRSDIITEIKSHILEARERNPGQDISQILSSLGEPETVANKYLIERGLKPGKPPKSPMVKWLTIGFLGTLGIAVSSILILIWTFTPVIKVDEKAGSVKILGGLIDINDKSGHVFVQHGDESSYFNGETPIDKEEITLIRIPFNNGKMEISPSDDDQLKWRCKCHEDDKDAALVSQDKGVFTLNLEKTNGVKCDIQLPASIATKIEGANGKLELIHPQGNLEVNLQNGKINITPDPKHRYRYTTRVINGHTHNFESSTDKNAIEIKLSLTNGKITQD